MAMGKKRKRTSTNEYVVSPRCVNLPKMCHFSSRSMRFLKVASSTDRGLRHLRRGAVRTVLVRELASGAESGAGDAHFRLLLLELFPTGLGLGAGQFSRGAIGRFAEQSGLQFLDFAVLRRRRRTRFDPVGARAD